MSMNDPRWGPIRKTGPRYRPRRRLGTPARRRKEFKAYEKHQAGFFNSRPSTHGQGAHHRFTAKESRRPSNIKPPSVPGINFHRTMKLFKPHEGERLRAKLFTALPKSAPEFHLRPSAVAVHRPSHLGIRVGVGLGAVGVTSLAGYETAHLLNKRRARKRKAAAAHRTGNRRGNPRHDSRGRFT